MSNQSSQTNQPDVEQLKSDAIQAFYFHAEHGIKSGEMLCSAFQELSLENFADFLQQIAVPEQFALILILAYLNIRDLPKISPVEQKNRALSFVRFVDFLSSDFFPPSTLVSLIATKIDGRSN